MRHSSWKPLLFGVAVVAGCSHQNSVAGTWAGTHNTSRGVLLDDTWTFTADGKLTTATQVTGGAFSGRTFTSDGVYTASNGTMTQAIDSMSEPGRTRTIAKPVTMTYQYTLSGDTLTINIPGLSSPLTFTRQNS